MGKETKGKAQSFGSKVVGSSEFGIVVALLLLCIIMSFLSPYFLKVANLINILYQISQYTILAVGMSLVILTGGIDLSVGYTVGVCGCLLAYLVANGVNIWVALIGTVAASILVGLVNGILITYLNLAPFIVTLGTGKIMAGLMLMITGGMPISIECKLNWLGSGKVLGIPVAVIVMLLIVILGTIFSRQTLTGRNIYAVGNSERAAALSGINVGRIKILVYVIQAVLAALCAVIATGKLRSADAQLGSGYEMDVIAAVVIGGFNMMGGEGKVWATLVGAAIVGVLKNAFVLLGLAAHWQTMSVGIVVILAVSIDPIKKFIRQRQIDNGYNSEK